MTGLIDSDCRSILYIAKICFYDECYEYDERYQYHICKTYVKSIDIALLLYMHNLPILVMVR